MGRGVDILAVGMMTAVGIGARQTAASVRAGVARLAESSVYNRSFQPMVMALIPEDELPPLDEKLGVVRDLTSRQARMLRLAGPALKEVTLDVPSAAGIPVLLGVPEAMPGRPEPAGADFLQRLQVQSGVMFDLSRSRLVPRGRAAGLLALEQAIESLDGGETREVIVGGVDSYLDLHLLGALDSEGRVLSDGVMDGFAPGEGAAFLLLASGGPRRPLAGVIAAASGTETGHRYSEEPYRGDGLAATVQSVFVSNGSSPVVQTVYAGLNGESFGAKEWGTAFVRSGEHFADDLRVEHPVDCFGDPGAALGPLLIGLAAIEMSSGGAPESCLVWCSSDRESRGAALLLRRST